MTELIVEFLSDGCFGGTRLTTVADVDTCQAVDAAGLPVIAGRLLKGLLMEEAAVVLRALGKDTPWHEMAAEAFGVPGSPSPGKLTIGDAGFPLQVRNALLAQLESDKSLAGLPTRALTAVRRQTAIGELGVAEEHSLRGTRLARRGLRLSSTVTWEDRPLSAAPPEPRALLAMAVSLLRRGGLHRTRGWGHIACSLTERGQPVDGWLTPIRRALEGHK